MGQPDVRVLADIGHVIENKGTGQGIGVDEHNDQRCSQKKQCFIRDTGPGRRLSRACGYFRFCADKDSLFSQAVCVKIDMASTSQASRRIILKEIEAVPIKISKMAMIVNARESRQYQNG